ncbi:hypothetical protein [Mesorhizobium sp. B2-3-4]|uniref:hypothetical protein n=1 Tax=Mesorhizobium sp. B2-3-4 TaxID=2589959 RepID=UPI00112D31F4|nr:hypothetical protein [Mesorhizobium sp. B2-3-4]TPM30898.1 hypothetical protein FJ967_25920 [Mesorhizobium sp. B2-3-4]
MTMKSLAICALALAVGCGAASSAFAGTRHYKHIDQQRYVPADDNLFDFLFGGPRYYDQQLFTTGAGPCSYDRTGPDGFAINHINDHHCGK